MYALTVSFEDSIANTLGALDEKKARGASLIRVLEDYRRFCTTREKSHSPRSKKAATPALPHQLETLYQRRAAVDQLIRSIEAYTACPQTHK